MKKWLTLGLLLLSVSCNEEVDRLLRRGEIGILDGAKLFRFFDKEHDIVCYSTNYRTLSCVKVDQREKQ